MNARRELDALVAEKVMGWANSTVGGILHVWTTTEKDGLLFCHHPIDQWSPSTDIAAAWEVVEKLKDANLDAGCFDFDLLYQRQEGAGEEGGPCWREIPEGKRWFCQFGDSDWACAHTPTAPLSICLAALKAVGYEVAP
jgi:hypothetical protein